MAQSPTQVEKRAIAAGWGVLKSIDKRRVVNYPTCASNFCIARVNAEGEMCRNCQTSNTTMAKGEFRGYTKNNLAGEPSVKPSVGREYHARIRVGEPLTDTNDLRLGVVALVQDLRCEGS